MDEGLRHPDRVRVADEGVDVPHGFAVRHHPVGDAGLWHEIIPMDGGRIALCIGRSPGDPGGTLRSRVRKVLRDSADPLRVLDSVRSEVTDLLCGLIDAEASLVEFGGSGDVAVIIAGPQLPERVIRPAAGRLVAETLPAGATVLFEVGASATAGLLDDCATPRPVQAVERVATRLAAADRSGRAVVLLYRQPPGALNLKIPARPDNLAAVRAQLRQWLALASVDPELSADVLLAVGEAASNATEHAALGVGHPVEMSILASISKGRMRFEVSDNGRWKTPPASPGHRGHGIRLINALVDSADLTASERGTTVEMFKELPLMSKELPR